MFGGRLLEAPPNMVGGVEDAQTSGTLWWFEVMHEFSNVEAFSDEAMS
jgi:hypothetical protein